MFINNVNEFVFLMVRNLEYKKYDEEKNQPLSHNTVYLFYIGKQLPWHILLTFYYSFVQPFSSLSTALEYFLF